MGKKFSETYFRIGMMCDLTINFNKKGSYRIIAVDFEHEKIKLHDCPIMLWNKFEDIELWEVTNAK